MRESGAGWSSETNFENVSHQDLLNMIAGADPQAVITVSNALGDASSHMQTLADSLFQSLPGLQWTGSAADAFRGWAQQVVQATDTLATYANNTSVGLQMAGETLSSVKASMPPLPTADIATVGRYRNQLFTNPVVASNSPIAASPVFNVSQVTPAQANAAQAAIDSAHQEAIGLMEKLGGSYVGAIASMGVSTVPTFPPTPAALMPPKGSGKFDSSGNVPSQGGATVSSGAYGGGSSSRSGSNSKGDSSSGGTAHGGAVPVTLVPVQPPATGGGHSSGGGTTTLQGVKPPSAPTSPGVPTGGSSGGGGTGGGGSTGPGGTVTPPPTGSGAGGGGGSDPSGSGSGGDEPGNGEAGGQGTAAGLGGGTNGRQPGGSGAGVESSGSEPVISGGVPASPAARGRFGSAAIGEDSVGGGGSAYSGSGGIGGYSAGVGDAAAASSTAQSGLTSEAATGEGSPSGGTESQSGGEMMPGGMGGMGRMGSSSGKRKGRRAAYLVEDDETWAAATPGANPSVIE